VDWKTSTVQKIEEDPQMKHLRIGLLAMAAVVGAALISSPGSAMPVSGLKAASEDLSDVENAYWSCRWYRRCYWVGPRYYGWYYRPYYRWYRPWYYRPYYRRWWWW
jgi:hypothetical protein